jgi:putative ABC transport system permease protein
MAFRSFSKDRLYALINLSGLAISLAGVFMIFAYVRYELSYDRSYSNHQKIYRIVSERIKNGKEEKSVMLPSPLAKTLQSEFPEIALSTTLNKIDMEFLVRKEPVKFETIEVDNNFFDVFNFPFRYGNAAFALKNNNSIVLTEKIAKTYFPNQNPVGLSLSHKTENGKVVLYMIAGVVKNIPSNTHFRAEAMLLNLGKSESLNWRSYWETTQYILLRKNNSIKDIQPKLRYIYSKYDFPKDIQLNFQPVTSIHLYSNVSDEPFANSDIKYIYIFCLITILVLAIACINYINLTIARSLKRVHEVGVRKVIGAGRKQLMIQFIAESILFFISSLLFALLIAYVLWPLFALIVNIQVAKSYLLDRNFIVALVLISLVSGALSGAYPAFFLSRLQPVQVLKDWQKNFRVNMKVRQTLIVVQFFVSVTLIISTAIIYSQLHLLNNINLGFNKDHLLALPWQRFGSKSQAFKNELLQNKNITGVTVASWKAGERYGSSSSMDNPEDSTSEWKFTFVDADFDFLKTMQIKLLEGRDFSPLYASDAINIDSILKKDNHKMSPDESLNLWSSRSIILTKQAADMLRIKEPISGQILKYGALQGTVIGEVPDFLGTSLLKETLPVIIRVEKEKEAGFTYIRIDPKNMQGSIDFIQSKWKQFFPDSRFEFAFVDERLQQLYDSERRIATLFNAFSALAIVVSIMGLFSLVALVIRQKTKEIGIRKVLGANTLEIISLLSKQFLALVGIAIVIAIPVTWWAMHKWLQDFSYRTTISPFPFIITSVGCMLFTFSVIAIQSLKAATLNPVKSLRTE